MDTDDDPEITQYQLKQRARTGTDANHVTSKDGGTLPYLGVSKTVIIRIILAIIFVGTGIGLLAWSVTRPENGADIPVPAESQFSLFENQVSKNGNLTVKINGHYFETSSAWLQNDKEKQLRIALGDRGLPSWIMDIYFLQYATYIFAWDKSDHSKVNCMVDWQWNYDHEIGQYDENHFTRQEDKTIRNHTETKANIFAGRGFMNNNETNVTIAWSAHGLMVQLLLENQNMEIDFWFGNTMQHRIPKLYTDIEEILSHHTQNCVDVAKQNSTLYDNFVQILRDHQIT